MTEPIKLCKLAGKAKLLAAELERTKDLKVHQRISQFYYMQKHTELLLLAEQLENAVERLSSLTRFIETEYNNIFCQWTKDMRWFQRYGMQDKVKS